MAATLASPFTTAEAGAGSPWGVRLPVDEDELGPDAEPLNGALHGEHRPLKDVQRVDLVDVSPGDAPGERALANERRERLAPRGRELLRVVEALDGTVGIKNHGRRADGAASGPRPASSTPATSVDEKSGSSEPKRLGRSVVGCVLEAADLATVRSW